MYELTSEQFASVPFDGTDHEICSRLIRMSIDSKINDYPMAWTQSTVDRPVINLRYKENGIIVAGELGFYYDDYFVVICYDRDHLVNRHKYKLNSGDGVMSISRIFFGSSPKPYNNHEINSVKSTKRQWLDFIIDWRKVVKKHS